MSEKKYKWDSSEYEKHSSAQYRWAKELIARLNLEGTESVLDVGCGDGKVTVAIADLLPKGNVVGVDNSKDMINLARKHLPDSKYQNLDFSIMDATCITFENQFDVIFSNAALHWTKNHMGVLAGVKKSLKKSGRLLFQMGGRGNAEDIIDILHDDLQHRDQWKKFFKDFEFPYGFYGPEDYEPWLQQAGLKSIRCELIPKDMTQKGKEGLAGWIRTTWLPYTQKVPIDLREKFISELISTYIETFPLDSEGFVHLGMVRLEVEAVNL
ncbi:methyltransferase domain-containing protein [Desulfobacterales bacterium HSG16]|nr:methyltransferase domain-containing protein [Desulfobacterales bacterium HSG16]